MCRLSIAVFVCSGLSLFGHSAKAGDPDQYNVIWTSPSADYSGSMPLGNGDISVNAWIEPSGELVFYIGKTDSWGDNGRLLKLGRIRVTIDPPPTSVVQFHQELRLSDATLVARIGDGLDRVEYRLWVDANHPVIHAAITSARPVAAGAMIELWRTERRELKSLEVSDVLLDRSKPDQRRQPVFVEPDILLDELTDAVGWCHHNTKSLGPTITGPVQGVSQWHREDPLLHRTFGALVTAVGAKRIDAQSLRCESGREQRFDIYVLTKHPATPTQWLRDLTDLRRAVEKTPLANRLTAHQQWWKRFWQRSWIEASRNRQQPNPSLIPANKHPVRIGEDQHGQNRMRGELGRLRIIPAVLDETALARLAESQGNQPPGRLPGQLFDATPEVGTVIADSQNWSFTDGLTIEGWLKPEKLPPGGGRIVDKVTPGAGDGMLFDTYPGNSLRLIVGSDQIAQKDILPAGQWSHVAAVVDHRLPRLAIYLNGKLLTERAGNGLDDAQTVSQMYALQRFIDACAGRGAYPIKFNGSVFTVPFEDRPGNADYRRWGPGYWWQNTRLPYISMCTSGDFEMMRPLFEMYAVRLMPLQKARTRIYLGHDGAFIPECIYFWGDIFSETYGWTPCDQREDKLQQNRYHKWEWVSGLELAWMMLDYYEHTQDSHFLQEIALPAADEFLMFFDQQYSLGPEGKLLMHPAQALETWWDATNPMPEVAGLHAVTARLLALPEAVTTSRQRAFWKALRGRLPDLPVREIDGQVALAPAAEFAMKRNIENPELYAVFPFRLVSFERDNASLGRVALEHRTDRGYRGWRQDDIFMAYLGLAQQARDNLVRRASTHDSHSRFPAFWGPNYDWVPDQDHGGILMKALQSMLLQTDGRQIYLAPAWPPDWDVTFRLHAPYRTVVEGQLVDGELRNLVVTPPERARDVVRVPRHSVR